MKTILLLISLISYVAIEAQVTDVNGKTYNTTTIGTQIWMSENLDVDRFQNGDIIPQAKTREEFEKAKSKQKPTWCYYDGRKIQDDPTNGEKYGKLYNWYAVNDKRGLAPKGFRISSEDDWAILGNYLGGLKFAAGFLKTSESWGSKDYFRNDYSTFTLECGGENSTYFNALPAGHVNSNWINLYISESAFFWTSSNNTNIEGQAIYFQMNGCKAYDPDRNVTHNELKRLNDSKNCYMSIRCLKN